MNLPMPLKLYDKIKEVIWYSYVHSTHAPLNLFNIEWLCLSLNRSNIRCPSVTGGGPLFSSEKQKCKSRISHIFSNYQHKVSLFLQWKFYPYIETKWMFSFACFHRMSYDYYILNTVPTDLKTSKILLVRHRRHWKLLLAK